MKKLFLICLSIFALQASATVHTVNNNPNGGTAFKEINDAIDVALSGDTIFVQGSTTQYLGFNLTDKKIVFVGPGFAPNKSLPQLATIAGGTVRNTAATGSSDGTEFNGLIFSGSLSFADSFTGSQVVNNVVIRRCQFNSPLYITSFSSASTTNYLIESNYFRLGSIAANQSSNYSNFIIRNNVFLITFQALSGFYNVSNIVIDHNLFYNNNSVFSTCRFLTITNNIFYKTNAGGPASNVSFSTFNNNIAFAGTNNTPWDDGNNVNSGGNLGATDPKIVANAAVNAGTDNPRLDFSVGAGAAKNAGSDGKDIGLLFDSTGSLNWANANAPRLPFIFTMNILNPTIGPGVSLNVEVTAKKQN